MAPRWQLTVGLLIGLALASCVGAACPAPQFIISCLPVRQWTQAEQNLAKIEYVGLPPKAQLRQFILDYQAMRDEARACHGAGPQPLDSRIRPS